MLGEFFAARPGEIDERLVDEGAAKRMPTVEAKGLSEVTLAKLGQLMGAGTYDDLVERIAVGRDSESGEAGILTVPVELRDGLAAATKFDTVATQWAATEELALDGWQRGDTLTLLRELSQLARDAKSADRDLWYWWSL